MAEDYIINFQKSSDDAKVSASSREVIKAIMKEAGVFQLTVTSTARSVYEQASAMYTNIVNEGVEAQKALYSDAGQQVIDAYVAAKALANSNQATIMAKMVEKIQQIGPSKVSHHCLDNDKLQVVDIAPSSIPSQKQADFEKAIDSAKSAGKISTSFKPPQDPAYHLEIPQP